MTGRLAFVLLGLLVFTTPALAQTGDITGTVTDAATGAPLFGAGDRSVLIDAYSTTGEPLGAFAVFETSGGYRFGLPPGTYYLRARATGYVSQLHGGTACNAADCNPTIGTAVTVTAGSQTVIDFAMDPGARVSGAVRRASDGSPLVNVEVEIFNASGSLERSVFTSGDGTYLVTGLTAGTHYARIRSSNVVVRDYIDELYGGLPCPRLPNPYPDPGCAVTRGTPIDLPAGGTVSGIDFSLDAAPRLSGTVRNSAGNPLGSVGIVGFTGDTEVARGRTDAAGEYTIAALPAGTYRVRTDLGWDDANPGAVDQWAGGLCVGCAGTPAPVTLTAGTTTTVDFTLAGNGGGIAGTLACCAGFVEVYDSAGRFVRSRPFGAIGTSSLQVGPTPYTFGGLAPGTYYVRAYDQPTAPIARPGPTRGEGGDYLHGGLHCAPEDCDVRRGTPVVVQAGETTRGIDIPLRIGGTIGVRVPDLPWMPWMVEVYDARGVRLRNRVRQGPPSYNIVGLPTGVYFLRMVWRADATTTSGAPQLYSGLICVDCPVTSGTPVFVTEGGTVSVSFTSAAGRTVAGTVRDAADASGLSTIRVELVTRDGTVITSDITDAIGLFRIRDLAPGSYFARTVNTRGYVDEVYDDVVCGGCEAARGTPIIVTADEDVSGVDFTLVRGTLVTGRVTGSDLPLSGAGVSLFSNLGAPAARAHSTVLGEYLAAVPAGTAFARSEPVAGFRQELYKDIACPNGTCDPTAGTQIAVGAATVTGIDLTLDACSAMTIAPLRLASAAAGSAYRQTLTAHGGTPPVVFTIAAGSLPPGLTLDSATGVISGTPTTAGRYDLTAAAVDAAGCTATRPYTLDVPACAFVLQGTGVSLASTPGGWMIVVSNACGDWTATSTEPWLTVGSVSATGVVISVDANPSPAPRRAAVLIGPRVFTVDQSGTSSTGTFGVFDTPVDGATVSGSIAVSGWALDELGVSRVAIYRDPVDGEPDALVFIGDATFVEGARGDVEAAFPSQPFNRRAGWGYLLLTNMLPNGGNGTFRLHAHAQASWSGQWVSLGTRTINVVNAGATLPFGAIDTPAQGATIGGADYLNWGWALTPQPQAIPESGSTIRVYIDGVLVGPLTRYDLFRSDVATLFPGLANSDGAVGYRRLDTTSLEEGMHTIAWVVTDDGGRAAGVGSRYFHVNNSAWQASAAVSGVESLVPATAPAFVMPATVPGVDLERRAASLANLPADDRVILVRKSAADGWFAPEPNARGEREITLRELERVEIDLAASATGACRSTYAGYLVANGELRTLPVGASLDGATGRFAWQPGPGFVGRYRLLIVRTECGGTQLRIPIQIVIAGQ